MFVGGAGVGVGEEWRSWVGVLLTFDMVQTCGWNFMTLPVYIFCKYQNIYIFMYLFANDILFINFHEDIMTTHIFHVLLREARGSDQLMQAAYQSVLGVKTIK